MKVRFTAEARREIAEILSYIANDNPTAARRVASEIETTVALLSRHPRIAMVVHESGIRAKLVGRFQYRIFYTFTDDMLTVRNVRSTRRRLPWDTSERGE